MVMKASSTQYGSLENSLLNLLSFAAEIHIGGSTVSPPEPAEPQPDEPPPTEKDELAQQGAETLTEPSGERPNPALRRPRLKHVFKKTVAGIRRSIKRVSCRHR